MAMFLGYTFYLMQFCWFRIVLCIETRNNTNLDIYIAQFAA